MKLVGTAALVAAVIASPAVAQAEPTCSGMSAGVCGASEQFKDDIFRHDLEDSGVLFNFNLEKHQGQRVCDDLKWGKSQMDAIDTLMEYGGYPFDIANSIATAGLDAYCYEFSSRPPSQRGP
jgi:hypothetical protein